jgi:hypothetical protein
MRFRSYLAAATAAAAMTLVPAGEANAQTQAPGAIARMVRLIERTYMRFERQADRTLASALRRVDILERKGASDDRIRAVIDGAKVALEAQAAAMRKDLAEYEEATDLVIARQAAARARSGALPTIDFAAIERRVESEVDQLMADGDEWLDHAFAALDAAAPAEEPEEEAF